MGLRKSEKADIKRRYPIYVQIGMIASLLILIGAFQANLDRGETQQIVMEEQEVVDIEEIQQTEQPQEPPPPPRPPAPIEVPDDEILDDQDFDFDATLDYDEAMEDTTPPPPPEEEEEEEEEIFMVVEDDPELIGGMQSLHERINYPDFARRAGIEGRVFVQFVVDTEGNVQDPECTRSPHRLLCEEALRVIQEAQFEPGRQRGEAVMVRMTMPINFQLQ